jgi:uncharacterized protein with HEPN domain
MPYKIEKLLQDVRLSCTEIADFIDDVSFEDFQEDRMLQLAIEREFGIIGEALYRLERIEEDTLSSKIPEYRKVIDFRNVIAHGYDIIDEAAMWDFAENRVPELLEKVENYCAASTKTPWLYNKRFKRTHLARVYQIWFMKLKVG